MSFEKKVIIVTGAARGIGQEYCRRLAALGAAVIAVDINACDQTVELVKSAGGRAIAGKVDVTDMASIEAAVAAAESALAFGIAARPPSRRSGARPEAASSILHRWPRLMGFRTRCITRPPRPR